MQLCVNNYKKKDGIEMSAKMWAGRFTKEVDERVNDFNSSISFDARMYRQDIEGSCAHAQMLGECGIIDRSESEKIIAGLKEILADIESGSFSLILTPRISICSMKRSLLPV